VTHEQASAGVRRVRAGTLTSAFAALGAEVDPALEQIDVPVFLIDREGRMRYLNKRAVRCFGDVRNRPFTSIFAPESQRAARLAFARKLLGTERVNTAERRLRTLDGDVPAEVHAVSIEAGHQVVGVFGIASPERRTAVKKSRRPPAGLTPRQAEVLGQLANGMSTTQIAAALGIEQETARNHIRAILRALGVHSRLEAVVEARRRGLLGD
jgi:PAS domain S-box-containing protein